MPIGDYTTWGTNSTTDSGYVYVPYIPLQVTPTILLDEFLGTTPLNSPLEDLVEGIYSEEIETGELKSVRKNCRRYKTTMLDPNFYQTVTIDDL